MVVAKEQQDNDHVVKEKQDNNQVAVEGEANLIQYSTPFISQDHEKDINHYYVLHDCSYNFFRSISTIIAMKFFKLS